MSLSNMKGLVFPDANKIQCRSCKNSMQGEILNIRCKEFPVRKPSNVYFEYAKCPKYEEGEDLLEYEDMD